MPILPWKFGIVLLACSWYNFTLVKVIKWCSFQIIIGSVPYLDILTMDNRLIPPSHFDPNENANSESLRNVNDSPGVPLLQNSRITHLRPPEDFTPADSSRKADVLNIGRRQNYCLPHGVYQERGKAQVRSYPSQQPDIHVPMSPERYSELLELKAENDALYSLLRKKKQELEEEVTQRILPRGHSHAHQAVIEHQLQLITRLQGDLDQQKSLVAKRENEILQCECAVARKQEEIDEIRRNAEATQDELQQKDGIMQLRSQEIVELKSEIENIKSHHENVATSHAATTKEMQEKCERDKETLIQLHDKRNDVLLRKHEDEKVTLTHEMVALQEQHRSETDNLARTHEEEKLELEQRMEKSKDNSLKIVASLETELTNVKTKCSALEKTLKQETAVKEGLQSDLAKAFEKESLAQANAEKQLARVTQLEAYIGKLQTEDYERSQWKNEQRKYDENILELQTEKQNLMKTMELQDIRLQSITKILKTQEDTVNASTKAFSSASKIGGLAPSVIRKWREKVLEMMVQMKSKDIESRNLENEHQTVQSDLREQLEDEKRVSIILENQLTESKAVLEMKQNEISQLSSKVASMSRHMAAMRSNLSDAESGAATMAECVEKSMGHLNDFFRDTMTQMNEKLIHMEQRLVFATNRMKTLQDLYKRRENILKARLKFRKETMSSPDQLDGVQEKELTHTEKRPDLIAEITRLTEERDSLSHKLSRDSALFDSATAQFKSQEGKLLSDIAALQHEVQNKSEELAEVKRRIESLEEQVQDKTKETSDANDKLRDVIQSQDRALQDRLEEAWNKWHEEKKCLLHKLEESQREHARTVVNSRQNERTAVREKKRAEENLEAICSEHKKEIANLKSRIKSLKVDNNLLMTTLRQQGLVNSYKAARKEAKDAQSFNSNEIKRACSGSKVSQKKKLSSPSRSLSSSEVRKKDGNVIVGEHSAPAVSDTSMEDLLKDLVVMTESILDDSG